jgi:stearoyl-CoA desaturase (delta-9 desaturase)
MRRRRPSRGHQAVQAAFANFQWDQAISIALLHALALLVLVPYLFSWTGVGAFVFGLLVFGQIGIPICYHRQLTHRSFRTSKWLERSFVVLALCSAQQTPAKWVAWHRKHHSLSDKPDDPHSPLVSFLWAHFGWLCVEDRELTDHSFFEKYARDVLEDPFYFYLERHRTAMIWIYLAHALAIFLVGLGAAWLVLGEGPAAVQVALSVLVWGVIARTVYVWHITWSVNSLSHLHGYRNFETSDDSRNNWFVALITGGEGWHNNHHADQSAATVQHRWWEIDLNYYVIKALEAVGLASHVIPSASRRRSQQVQRRELAFESGHEQESPELAASTVEP